MSCKTWAAGEGNTVVDGVGAPEVGGWAGVKGELEDKLHLASR